MDARRLDDLTKTLAAGRSRRTVVRALVASITAGVTGGLGHRRAADSRARLTFSQPDDVGPIIPDLSDTFVLPEDFGLVRSTMYYDPAALESIGFSQGATAEINPGFVAGFQSVVSNCSDDTPCDEARISAIVHLDAAAAAQRTEALFSGLPDEFVNQTDANALDGVGQSQFIVDYPIEIDGVDSEVIHVGFHVDEISCEVVWIGSSPAIDTVRLLAEEVRERLARITMPAPIPTPGSLILRFEGEVSHQLTPLVADETPIPLAGRTPDDQEIYNTEFAGVVNGIRGRHEVIGPDGSPRLIVVNTVLRLPDLDAAQSYLDAWPGLYQPVLDLQGIVGEVTDSPGLFGDEEFQTAFRFTVGGEGDMVTDGLVLAGLFQGPASTWFASVSTRMTTPRLLTPDGSFSVEPYQEELRAIAGSGYISAYDSALRAALTEGSDDPHALLPPIAPPDLSGLSTEGGGTD